MCLFFSLIPATFWVVVGYFVLLTSTNAEGAIKKFGKILAIWMFIIALLFPVCGIYVTFSDKCPMNKMMQKTEIPAIK